MARARVLPVVGIATGAVVSSIGGGQMASLWTLWERLTPAERLKLGAAATGLVTIGTVLTIFAAGELGRGQDRR